MLAFGCPKLHLNNKGGNFMFSIELCHFKGDIYLSCNA